MRIVLAFAAALVLSLGHANAQTPEAPVAPVAPPPVDDEQKEAARDVAVIPVSWSIPDSPAAGALDVARSETSPPSMARGVSYEVLTTDGASGFAGEVSPYLLYLRTYYGNEDPRGALSLQRYRRDWGTRALARLSVSAAYVPGAEDDGDRAALGLRWTAVNFNDPYMNAAYLGCIDDAVVSTIVRDESGPPPINPRTGLRESPVILPSPERVEKLNDCRSEHGAGVWNATALQFAAVQIWRGIDGEDLEDAGTRVSAIGSYGFDRSPNLRDNSQILLSLSRGADVAVQDETETWVRRDETTIGLKLRVSPSIRPDGCSMEEGGRCFNVYGEAAYSEHDYASQTDQEEWQYTLGAEWEVRENLWIGVSVQDRSGDDITGDEQRAGFQVRFAFNDRARLGRSHD